MARPPAHNQDTWKTDFEAALREPRIGALVHERLSRDRLNRKRR